jgi:PAS domain S-box-containing protein
LETINEELQSTNASLDAVNSELGTRTEELNRANLSQQTMIEAVSAAIIGVDDQGQITLWNPAAERMFNKSEDQLRDHSLQRISLAPIPRPLTIRIKRALARKAALSVDRFEAKMNGRIARLRCDLIQLSNRDTNYGAILIIDAVRQSGRAVAQSVGPQKRG